MVFMCYAVVGTLGYFAFAGSNFQNYFNSQPANAPDRGVLS